MPGSCLDYFLEGCHSLVASPLHGDLVAICFDDNMEDHAVNNGIHHAMPVLQFNDMEQNGTTNK